MRKKYNKLKQLTRAADYFVKDVLVAYTDNLGGCVMLHRRHKRIIPPESREGVSQWRHSVDRTSGAV